MAKVLLMFGGLTGTVGVIKWLEQTASAVVFLVVVRICGVFCKLLTLAGEI